MPNLRIIIMAWFALGALLVQALDLGREGQTVGDFRMPQYDKEGRKTSEIFGDYATVRSDGTFEIRGLRLDYYQDEEVDIRVTSPSCIFDEKRGTAKSDDAVRISRENMVVTGEGFRWDRETEVFEIFRKTRVVLKGLGHQVKGGNE
jgi:hypothetical protein